MKKTQRPKKVSLEPTKSIKKSPSEITSVSDIPPYQSKKKEKYMSKEMQGHFRKILVVWKTELRQAVDRTVSSMKETATNFSDLSDRATQEETFGFELRERDRERQLIEKIDDAIRMIDEGSYGYCEVCGEEIGVRRLEARPTATLCIDCKTLDEIRERQVGG